MQIKNNTINLPLVNYFYACPPWRDEAGNRIRKLIFTNSNEFAGPVLDWNNLTNPGNGWVLYQNEFYVRGVNGSELATYNDTTITEWYVYGNELVGKIKGTTGYYYYKDHLGSVRAIVNDNGELISAKDYDAWGYLLEGRSYDSDSTKYKFTGKERDKESEYDYFGARYYDARIGRWGGVDPLFEKYISTSPYSYVLSNPLILIDPNGKWTARYDEASGRIYVTAEENDNFEDLYTQLDLTSEEFYERYRDYINDPEKFELSAGFELDVTKQVIDNAIFESDQTNMNCFSSCFAAIGLFNLEIQAKTEAINFANSLITGFGLEEKSQIKTGYMRTYEDKEKVTHHAAIYIVRSQKGLEYYFGRPGPNTKLQVQTSDRLNQLYPDFKTYVLYYPRSK